MSSATVISPRSENPARPYDLAVCYRIYPRISGKPILGFKDKFELVTLNLESFRDAVGGLKIKLWVLLDKCPPEYRTLVETLFPAMDKEIIELNGIGNEATFGRQIAVLSGQTVSDLVYFAEDDYLYLPGALEKAVSVMQRHPEVDFLTLFDHADYHRLYLHRSSRNHLVEGRQKWRAVCATCLTFMARRQALGETADVFRTYQRKNSDLGLWLALTKLRLFNPWFYLRSVSDGLFIPASACMSWRYALRQVLFGSRRLLLAPQPSLATHLEPSTVAPGVDWEREFAPRRKGLKV